MLTRHAETRCRQRGVKREVLGILLRFGRRQYRHGAEICFMDHRARAQAERSLGRKLYARLERSLDSYLVLSDDGAIITVAPRMGRLKFH